MNELNLGKVAVVDLEATCWEGPPPEGQRSEIIEVGVCLLTVPTLEISRPRRIFIRPSFSGVSGFCTKLTGITADTLAEKGKTIYDAASILIHEFKLNERVWAGWGSDGLELREATGERFNDSYVNLCSLFSTMVGSPNRVGLDRALEMCDLEFSGVRHTGGDDAYNTCRVLRWMMERMRQTGASIPSKE